MQVFKPETIPTDGGIYKFTFDSGYFYIGSSQNLYKRIQSHEKIILTNRQKAMNRFVKKAVSISTTVTFEILKIVHIEDERKRQEEVYLLEFGRDNNCLNYLEKVIFQPIGSAKPKQISASVRIETIDAINSIRETSPKLLCEMMGGMLLSFSESVDVLLASHPIVIAELEKIKSKPKK